MLTGEGPRATGPASARLDPLSRRGILRGLLLAVLVVLAYVPALRGAFVWDDDANVTANPVIASPRGIFRIWSDVHSTQQFYPLTHSSFWLTYQLFGPRPLPFHVTNVALHALSAWLVVVVLSELGARGAWLCGMIFALHPVHAESVAWITERKNCLSLVFALLSVYLFVLRERGRSPSKLLAGSLLAFVLALLSKTAVAPLPAVLLLVGIARHGRLRRQDALALVPFVLLGAAFAGVTAWLETRHVGAHGAEFSWGASERIAIALRGLTFYPEKLFAPAGLMFLYPRWDTSFAHPGPWISMVVVATAAALLLATRERLGPWPLALAGAYVALIFPALGFVNLYFMRYGFAQNHFQYFASIPLLALASEAIVRSGAIGRLSKAARGALVAGTAAVLSLLTFGEASAFSDNRTLLTRALADNPDAWMAAHNLAEEAEAEGRHEEALRLFTQELRVRPVAPASFNDRGVVETRLGLWDASIADFAAAHRIDPADASFVHNLAMAEERAGHDAAAREHYEQALALRPDAAKIALGLAWLLATSEDDRVRDGARALRLAETAAQREPRASALDVEAAAHAELGDFAAAVRLEDEAVAAAQSARPSRPIAPLVRHAAAYRAGLPYREHHGAPERR